MKYPFLIDDALKAGRGTISALTQDVLMDYAISEGASKEQFLKDLDKKTSSFYVFQRKAIKNDEHKCITCGANIPVIAQKCDYCGVQIVQEILTEYSEKQIMDEITGIISKLGKKPKPTFIRTLLGNLYIILPILTLYLVIIFEGAIWGGI
jgi:hypothetical protein